MSFTMTVPTLPSSIIPSRRFQSGRSNVVPEKPSSTKNMMLVKPFSSAYFCNIIFWFLMLLESPCCSSSLERRQYSAVILLSEDCLFITPPLRQSSSGYPYIGIPAQRSQVISARPTHLATSSAHPEFGLQAGNAQAGAQHLAVLPERGEASLRISFLSFS